MITWTAILGLVGIFAAGGFTVIGVYIGKARERDQWLRTERTRAYSEFVTAIDTGASDLTRVMLLGNATPSDIVDRATKAMTDPLSALALVAVVGPESVYDEAKRYCGLMTRIMRDAALPGATEQLAALRELEDHEKPVTNEQAQASRTAVLAAMRKALGTT